MAAHPVVFWQSNWAKQKGAEKIVYNEPMGPIKSRCVFFVLVWFWENCSVSTFFSDYRNLRENA